MPFQAFCPKCNKTVTAFAIPTPNISGKPTANLRVAVNNGGRIEITHPTHEGEHRWIVSNQSPKCKSV